MVLTDKDDFIELNQNVLSILLFLWSNVDFICTKLVIIVINGACINYDFEWHHFLMQLNLVFKNHVIY